jgi:negative regulator of flagellin synthesis FlgM
MEISDNNPSINVNNFVQDLQDKATGKSEEDKKTQIVSNDVKVELSSQSQEMVKLKNRMASIPDIRTEKLDQLKNQISEGTYKIDGNQVALKMIKESILDELA